LSKPIPAKPDPVTRNPLDDKLFWMKFWTTLFLIFLSLPCWSAPVPTRFRYEVHLGKAWSNYTEKRFSVLVEDRDIDQSSYMGEFQGTYWAVPRYLDFNLGTRQIGFAPETDNPDEAYSLNHSWANIGLHLPLFSDFLWFKLVGEGFYANMSSQDGFGFTGLTGGTIYPGLEYFPKGSDLFFSASPFIKVPLASGDNVWREYTYGLKLRFPVVRGQARFPLYAYQKALVIRIIYSKLEMNIRKPGYLPVDAGNTWTGLTLGFEW
jgi:hypothetical protein